MQCKQNYPATLALSDKTNMVSSATDPSDKTNTKKHRPCGLIYHPETILVCNNLTEAQWYAVFRFMALAY